MLRVGTREELGSCRNPSCHALLEKQFTLSLIITVSALFRGCNPTGVFPRVLVGRWSLDVVGRACGLGSELGMGQPGILAIPSQPRPERSVMSSKSHSQITGGE